MISFFLKKIELMKVINSKIDPSKNLTPKQNYLIESSDQVRAIVFSFIEAAKSYLTNPYDFLSKQSMETKW